jgi:hypothetical protein
MRPSIGIELLHDGFGRIQQSVHGVLEGLDPAHLTYRPDPRGNTISWLVWHLTRIQDDHVAGAFGTDQIWHAGGWYDRSGLPLPAHDHGYGHTSAQVADVGLDAAFLAGYHDAVHDQTVSRLGTVADDDWGRIVDERWDPPVTLAVRLVSVLNDDMQHVGQAAYVRGLAERAAT